MNFTGFEGFANGAMIMGGGSLVAGALLYGPISGMGYNSYASGALLVGSSIAISIAALFAAQASSRN